ncbi:aminotransferase-like domain-containing protein [Paractinoplanes hotanensis]|uniref:PLP-dependent aminotransferase family protein n=1 Tax=Paractinoplanes hotanensis TaxID=2906497 RepID=A0ABT0YCC1_9ACTN|nr:PLP-dependent aminotransferase family protein [Actinoplanes hotanensis]
MDRTTVAGPPAGHLELAQLHGSLRDPLLDTMTFLNEVTARYPRAISFAPGRPYEDDFDVEEPVRDLAAYVAHLRGEGADEAEIRRTLLQYGPTAGTIREVVARTLAHDGLPVDPDHLVITVGAQEALLITLRALLADDHDVLLVTDPAYVGVTGAARLLDARVHPVAEGPDGPDPHALTTTLRDVRERGLRPRALSVVPDFANPSGTSMSVSARRRLLDLLRPEGVLVVEDNPYRLLGPAPHPPTLKALDRHRQVVHIGSFAKTLFPGARIGYVVADQVVHRPDGTTGTLAHELARLKSMITVNTPPLAQAVVAGALHRRDLRLGPATAGAAQRYASLMTLLRSELTRLFPPADRERLGVSWNDPAGGFFIALTVPFPAGPEALARCAEEFGVLWTPMRYFHADTAGDRVIRLSISCLDRDQVITGAERLAAFVRDEDERS